MGYVQRQWESWCPIPREGQAFYTPLINLANQEAGELLVLTVLDLHIYLMCFV